MTAVRINERCSCGESIEYEPSDVHGSTVSGWREVHQEGCDYGTVLQGDAAISSAVALLGIQDEIAEIRNLLRELIGVLHSRLGDR